MAPPIKRVRYFDHQFLHANDFTDEQTYHVRLSQLHNSLLHTPGIASGLGLRAAIGQSLVTVDPGVAVDSDGHLIMLADAGQVDVSGFQNATVFITIAWAQQDTDPSTDSTGATGNINTRYTETPSLGAQTAAPDNRTRLILGRVTTDATGKVNAAPDNGVAPNVRRPAGVVGGALEVLSLALTDPGVATAQWPRLRLSAPSTAELQGNLTVTGTVNGRNVANDGSRLDAHLANTANPHSTTAAQVGALPAAGGTLSGNLAINGTLTTTGNVTAPALVSPTGAAGTVALTGNLTVSGTVNGRNVANDGTRLDQHLAITNGNPHGTTAAQVGAVPTTGGAISGNLTVNNNTVLLGGAGTSNSIGLGTTPDKPVSVFISASATPNITTAIKAALLVQPVTAGVEGVHILPPTAPSGGTVPEALTVEGHVTITGGKSAYVTDIFVNRSGQILRTGDVVKLAGTGTVRFYGVDNRIPIPEVTLADGESDPLVIGVVDREAAPLPGEPDRRTDPSDPTAIPDGGDLHLVTLGTFAHCKVDATEAPIEVGDLLTSSANPGHAKKATEPKVGSVIGKALEPLREGIGYISVFVNIQ